MKRNNTWKYCSIISFVISLIPLFLGVNKMFIYSDDINTYVGGDAYNYIINANYSTAYFVLFGIFVVAAIGFLVLWYLSGILLGHKECSEEIFDELPDM